MKKLIFLPPLLVYNALLPCSKSTTAHNLNKNLFLFKPTSKLCQERMNRRNNNNTPDLDLKLSLSTSRGSRNNSNNNNNHHLRMASSSPTRSSTMSSASPPSPNSCVTSMEMNQEERTPMLRFTSSPDATKMVVVGCPRCFMYVMLAVDDPKCPQCQSTVLLDVDGNRRRF
ncbi:Protein GL2-INTERACTING REPRESSOR 1 [Linum grandiflorum]